MPFTVLAATDHLVELWEVELMYGCFCVESEELRERKVDLCLQGLELLDNLLFGPENFDYDTLLFLWFLEASR